MAYNSDIVFVPNRLITGVCSILTWHKLGDQSGLCKSKVSSFQLLLQVALHEYLGVITTLKPVVIYIQPFLWFSFSASLHEVWVFSPLIVMWNAINIASGVVITLTLKSNKQIKNTCVCSVMNGLTICHKR